MQPLNPALKDHFFLNGEDAKLYPHTFQTSPVVQFFENYSVQLPILAAQLTLADGSVLNLHPGDGNTEFPKTADAWLSKHSNF